MKCPFELPVRKVMKASKSLWVYSKDDFLICKCFGHQRADYIVQAINSYVPREESENTTTELEKAAKKAARTGNRSDLQAYLKLRRNYL